MEQLRQRHFVTGEKICCEGETGDVAYILTSGRVSVTRNSPDGEVILAELGERQLFGEMALVSDGMRSATITALEPCSTVLLERSQLSKRISDLDPIMRAVFEIILGRFRATLNNMQGVCTDPASSFPAAELNDALEQLNFEADIQRGIKSNEFSLHYQPIVCLRTGKIAGFEGLMRWQHPEAGLVLPATFINVAEDSGLITDISRIAIKCACQNLQEINLAALKNPENAKPPFISVNITARDLEQEDFFDFVISEMHRNGIAENQLKLELTESSLMGNIEQGIEQLNRFNNAGLAISIDDFGTGYSSMGYLAKMPITTLKIDRSFITSMLNSEQTQKVTNGILRMADELGMHVVAEGIESTWQDRHLRNANCTFGQGYLYAKPQSIKDTVKTVREWDVIASTVAAKRSSG